MKQPKCANCREPFTRTRAFQNWCSPECGLALVKKKQVKERKSLDQLERKELQVRKKALKRRNDYMREAQQAFNAYIRERDRIAGHPCISSGRPLDWSGNNVDAGHYRSVGAAPHLRFNEANCHAQSKEQNRFLSGNAIDYRINLIQRIGLEAVEALESNNEVVRWTIPELEQIKAHYRALVRQMKKDAA